MFIALHSPSLSLSLLTSDALSVVAETNVVDVTVILAWAVCESRDVVEHSVVPGMVYINSDVWDLHDRCTSRTLTWSVCDVIFSLCL